MFEFYNPNPRNKLIGDCVVRAIAVSTDRSWEDVYMDLCVQGLYMHDMPSSNHVWSSYLYRIGYNDQIVAPISVREFSASHDTGNYILSTGTHVIALMDGIYIDTWDSGDEIIERVFKK